MSDRKNWSKLTGRQKSGKVERFEYIMNKINNASNGVTSDVNYDEKISALEDRIKVLEDKLNEDESEDGESLLGTVSVTVKDEDGKSLQGVEVLVSDGNTGDEYSGLTGSAGGCNINNIPLGDYKLLGFKDGYDQYYGEVTVVAGVVEKEFVMIKSVDDEI